MIIRKGEKVHVVTRRNFPDELRRHFAGEVEELDGSVVRVKGYAFVFDPAIAQFKKLRSERTSIFNLAESGYLVNIIHPDVDIQNLDYCLDGDKKLVLTDGKNFSVSVNEFGISR